MSHPPGPKGIPIFGSFFKFTKDMPDFLVALREKHGDLSSFVLGPGRRGYLLGHPDLIRKVLVDDAHLFIKSRGLQRIRNTLGNGLLTNEGDFHLRQRRIAAKAFLKQRIAAYADCMVGFSDEASGRIQNGQQVDVGEMMMHLTLRIVAKTLFDTDSSRDAAVVDHALTELQRLFPFLLLPFSEYFEHLPLPQVKRFEKARDALDEIIYGIIAERRRDSRDRGDLLSMLMLATDEEGDGGRMDDVQLRDESITLFLAGHETTANALVWAFYLLARHPEKYQELQQEVDRVLGQRLATVEDYSALTYTRMVVAEAMRLFPPAWTMGRTPMEPYDLAGYTVQPNSVVLLSPFVVQRDSRWFPDPLVFEPRRFEPEADKTRPKYAYFPFGAGRRKCIGERFAWMEAVLILATFSQRWRFHYDGGRALRTWASLTVRPKDGLTMRAVRR